MEKMKPSLSSHIPVPSFRPQRRAHAHILKATSSQRGQCFLFSILFSYNHPPGGDDDLGDEEDNRYKVLLSRLLVTYHVPGTVPTDVISFSPSRGWGYYYTHLKKAS